MNNTEIGRYDPVSKVYRNVSTTDRAINKILSNGFQQSVPSFDELLRQNNGMYQNPYNFRLKKLDNKDLSLTEQGNMTLDVPLQFVDNNHVSDEDLYARMWKNIKQHEAVISHPYLDTKGFITIGGGANVNDWNTFKNLNVTVDGIPATEAQKLKAYNRMHQLSEEKDANGNYLYHNTKAENFAPYTNIRLSDTEARGLAQNHMNNDLAHLRGEFSDFDDFPLPLKEVLLDIQYNTGSLNQQKWPNLYNAIHNRNVDGIVSNVHRQDVAQKRNNWARDAARSIRF